MPGMREPAVSGSPGPTSTAADATLAGRLRTLANLNRLVSSSLDIGEVLAELARAAATLMNATFVSFSVADDATRVLEVGGFSDPVVGADLPFRRRRYDEGVVGWVATNRQPLDVPDVFNDPRVSAPNFCRRHGLTSFYGLPILLDDTLLGVLSLTGRAPFRFTPDDHELLDGFAAQAAAAIRNARLYHDTQQRLQQTRAVLTVAQSLSSSLDATEIARRAAREVTRFLGGDTSIFFEIDETSSFGLPIAGYRIPPHLLDPNYRVAVRGLPSFFTGTRQPIATADVPNDPRLDHPAFRALSVTPQSMLYAPVVFRGRVTGALVTYWWTASHAVTDDEIQVVVTVAQQLLLALQNARLYEEQERRRREAEVTADIARAIGESADVDTILTHVATGALELCQADTARIALEDGGAGEVVSRCWLGGRYTDAEPLRIAPGQGSGGQVLRTRAPFRTSDYLEDSRIGKDFHAIAEREGIHAQLVVPIEAGGGLEGLFYVSRRSTRAFTARDEAGLLRLAGHVCLALAHARQAAREQESRARVEASEKALRESAERFRSIMDAASDAIIVSDRHGRIVSWNRGAQAMFGYAESEILGRPLSVLMPERHHRAHAEGLGRFMATGQSRIVGSSVELEGMRKDGSEFPLELSLASWTTAGERFVSGILRDVTERKRAEEALRQSEERLRHAQKMEAVGRLAGGIAHDFNNLLTVIGGRAEILRARVAADVRSHAEIIRESTARAAALTRQLLVFSRKQVMEAVSLDLNDVVRGMTGILTGVLAESIEFVFTPDPELGRVTADRGQIEQVIMNLVVNARDAMAGGGRLDIATANVTIDDAPSLRRPDLRAGRYVALTVTDTGCGMSAEVQAHIFEPFFTTKPPDKGTGLGLATAYGVVKQSGGDIVVDSAPGQGTVFSIYLPRSDQTVVAGSTAALVAVETRGIETVLLVEDEPEVAHLVEDILRDHGYTVLSATRPSDALALAERSAGAIDLLLTDVVLPEMSGPDLAARLAVLRPHLAHLPVLYMSGYPDATRAAHGQFTRGLKLLLKPFTAQELTTRVRSVLERRPPEST
jgi:PAS domain S-box-containing protein